MPDRDFEKRDANWWDFSVDEKRRGEKIRDDAGAGTVEINADLDGRRLLSYAGYLRLDRLLGAQVPSSRAPEERVFVVTHQLIELVFKQAIFDLSVVAATLQRLLALDAPAFARLVTPGRAGADEPGARDFWVPSLTAAARVRHGLGQVLPQLIGYLANEETFDNREFATRFRVNLAPASGFQSAQIRLIQRALGKSPLVGLPIFPADTYLKNYAGLEDAAVLRLILASEKAGLVSVTDELILREQAPIAAPPADSPLHAVTQLDDLAHAVLARLGAEAVPGEEAASQPFVPPLIPADDSSPDGVRGTFLRRMRESLEGIRRRKDPGAVLSAEDELAVRRRADVFARHWSSATARENERRRGLQPACRGALLLLRRDAGCPAAVVLDHLAAADDALCGDFLSYHQKFVRRRIGELPGTAGGGVPFLEISRTLTALFPALIAFRAARTIVDKGSGGT